MCTYNINVSEQAISKIRPSVSPDAFGLLLQQYVDALVDELTTQTLTLSPNGHTKDAMRSIVADRIHLMEAGNASFVDGEVGFAEVRKQYGL